MKDSRSRRDFLKSTVATAAVAGGAGACMCGLSGCAGNTPEVDKAAIQRKEGKIHLDLAKAPKLEKVGASVRLAGNDIPGPIIVVRADEDEYVALSIKCTHFGRSVEYNHESGVLRCVSFGHSEFDLEGKVVKGPAKNALKTYETALQDGTLLISV